MICLMTADWDSWFQGYEAEHTKFRGRSDKDEFDSTLGRCLVKTLG